MELYLFQELGDMPLILAGSEQCAPGHFFGPAVRNHFLVHYVVSGHGIYRADGKTYHLGAGQAFLITEGNIIYYEADEKDPWHYMWFEAEGDAVLSFLKAASLKREHPIYNTTQPSLVKSRFAALMEAGRTGEAFTISGAFYSLLGSMVTTNAVPAPLPEKSATQYVEAAKQYIKLNYFGRVRISDLCALTCIERSYLCRLFQEHTGYSPQEYVIRYKLSRARELLKRDDLSIRQVASSVGYEDQAAFSRLFKKRYGLSPKKMRENMADKPIVS